MKKTCILTDETAQFLDLSFEGQDHVQLMPIRVSLRGVVPDEIAQLKASQLPLAGMNASVPLLSAPSVETFVRAFANLSGSFTEIVVVLSSAGLTDCVRHAADAMEQTRGRYKVSLVDSGVVGVGLGVLVAAAAEQAAAGAGANDIKRLLMGIAPQVYSVFCVRNLAYLERLGIVAPAQAIVGEMLGVHQLFYLNAGKLIPVQKIRNSRHMVESILEFVSEFDHPQRVALQQAGLGFQQEARTIRERLLQEYKDVRVHEMALSIPLAALFGPQSFGLFLWEFHL